MRTLGAPDLVDKNCLGDAFFYDDNKDHILGNIKDNNIQDNIIYKQQQLNGKIPNICKKCLRNQKCYLTYKELLFVLFFTFDILTYFGELNNISHEQQQLIQFADDEYYKDPLTIEREVVLRRLVKQYQQKDIPDTYKGLLHDKHRIILNRVISQSRK